MTDSDSDEIHRPWIVLLAEYYSSGGTRTYMLQLLELYRQWGLRVILVGLDHAPDDEVSAALLEWEGEYQSYSGVMAHGHRQPAPELRPTPWSPMRFRRERRAFARLVRERKALGLVATAGTPGLFLGAASAQPSSLYILHTYPHGRRQELMGRVVMGWYTQHVPSFVAVSQFEKSQMVRLWGLGSREAAVRVVLNTAGPEISEHETSQQSQRLVITASWVEPYKSPDQWVSVASQVIRDMGTEAPRFLWLGEGSMLEEAREDVARRGLDGRVQFVGHVDDVSTYYRQAACYLQMSAVENMSLSTIDSLRFGVPAVVTDVGGLPEITVDGETGYVVDAGDVQGAAHAVRDLLSNTDRWSEMSTQARRRYRQHFSERRWMEGMAAAHGHIVGVRAL